MSVFEEWVKNVIPEKSNGAGGFEYTPIGGAVEVDKAEEQKAVENLQAEVENEERIDFIRMSAILHEGAEATAEEVKLYIRKLVAARAEMEKWKGRALTAEGKIAQAVGVLGVRSK